MKEMIHHMDRHSALKLIAISVCVLELFITLFTLTYQQDVVKRTETPISQEMAQIYIDQPEKLRPDERLALNTYSGSRNPQTYLLVKEVEEVIPFPWKAWILISVGVPIGIAFLVLLISKAYFQAVEPGESEAVGPSGKFVSALNRLSQINIIWFMLLSIIVIFLFWYIPEIVKYTGGVAMTWLTQYWWIPATVFFVGVLIFVFWMYLHYRLKLKAMNMEMELAKFKFLQLEGKSQILIENKGGTPIHLLEEGRANGDQQENKNMAASG
ncbi:MAG: hypothetical protein MUE70_14660 [Desulfobacterales bacterium]|nr:hypothetical protein [Desulfobacterales bacterium]